jgi:eukaryotic-like serine/threonine-protein kinase
MARGLSSKDDLAPEKFGRFFLRELINTGGMAEIWRVTDERNKQFALRRLRRDLRFNFTARRRFKQGNAVLEKLAGAEHIVGYVEHGSDYLIMDFIEAENLKELYARQDAVLTENVAQILIDMAEGLHDIHEGGFMHLDFKPENVLVSRNGAVRLIDFDMAQPLPEEPKKFSKNPGTPGYMAPEQLQRQGIDGRADIFAYGVAAYELLTQQKPFPGDTPAAILAAQLDPAGPIPPRELNPAIPAAMEKTVLRCLEREPDKRYPFTSLLLRDVQAALYV